MVTKTLSEASQVRADNAEKPLSPAGTTIPVAQPFGGGIDLFSQTATVDAQIANAGINTEYSSSNDPGGNPNAPLSSLSKNKYEQATFSYPRDLASFDKGHAVQFQIRDIKPAEIKKFIQAASNITPAQALQATKNAVNNVLSGAKQTGGSIINSTKQLSNADVSGAIETMTNSVGGKALGDAVKTVKDKWVSNGRISFSPETEYEPTSTIYLYMPDSLSFGYDVQYDKLSVAEALNSVPLVGRISRAIQSAPGKALTNKLGYVFNPQQQLLFEGIDFRHFEMNFTFTPTSQNEAIAVKNIIKRLRYHAAPTINNSAGGFFFTPPSVFDITFLFNGNQNTNINPIRRCVLEAINVDYAPNGWTALNDGMPVQTTISLSFRETELVDRLSIYNEPTGGVKL